VGTGCQVQHSESDRVLYVIVPGDLDGNGLIMSSDYIKVKQYFNGNMDLEHWQLVAADIDRDGSITSTDYIKMKKYFSGDPLW
jgi:hypothetical protein